MSTFPEGAPRNRAMGVYAAMSAAGGAIGLIVGGLLVSYVSWRWVLFVNVPIGAAAALAAPAVISESGRRRGRLDLPGAITGTGGIAALVYGLSYAATSPLQGNGQVGGASHWGDARVVASLAASAALLAAFAVIEIRSRHPLLPLRLLRDRDRTGANLIMLCVGTALFGMFFFLTLFMQLVWGYSALRTGVAYLPLAGVIGAASGAAARLISRLGARPLLLAGSAVVAGGLYWMSRMTEHSSYAGGLLGPMLLTAAGLGLLFVPLTLVAMSRVREEDSGVASSLRNTAQQVGGSIGLAVLGTFAWTVVASTARAQAARAGQRAHSGHPGRAVTTAIYNHALAQGFSRAFLVGAGVMLLGLVITLVAIRIRPADLDGSAI
jgi:predicted MFS family arabinose efflux permease